MPPMVCKTELYVRMAEVEETLKNQSEELKAQREWIYVVMKQIDKRFEEMGWRLDRFMFWSLELKVSASLLIATI
ncbi:MAG: hypothetical protein Q7U98_06420 [Methylicorpusculum sp.]|uniref:hypothetical protein n=1 Tax=Methylicorpusculum sp. TaxID=2713644 RepID=UPI00271D940E|nr:hypothetical protein [Methylicorpusculum sp.]MDO8938774.1 hypothetical protein [Methylicorpusculum sp.]MDP2201247.1 hypothetical protein [Methylicorpusculum sp.]